MGAGLPKLGGMGWFFERISVPQSRDGLTESVARGGGRLSVVWEGRRRMSFRQALPSRWAAQGAGLAKSRGLRVLGEDGGRRWGWIFLDRITGWVGLTRCVARGWMGALEERGREMGAGSEAGTWPVPLLGGSGSSEYERGRTGEWDAARPGVLGCGQSVRAPFGVAGWTKVGELLESARGLAHSRTLRGFVSPRTFDLQPEHLALSTLLCPHLSGTPCGNSMPGRGWWRVSSGGVGALGRVSSRGPWRRVQVRPGL